MTRINCIPVTELTDRHLVAEYRELPRVFGLVRAAQERGETPDMSGQYTMGKGHVRFFYPRLGYCITRQTQLISEMKRRGMEPQYDNPYTLGAGIDWQWFGRWEPNDRDMAVNRARIAERLAAA